MKTIRLITMLALLTFITNSYGQKIQFVTENSPPFQIQEQGKQLTGFAVELVESLIDRAGINAHINVYPWARAYMMAQKEPNVFIFSIARTKERENLFQWIGDYYTETDAFFALASRKDIILNSIEDATRYTIAIPRGDMAEVRLKAYDFTKNNIHYVINQKQSIEMLHKGRVDLNFNNYLGFFSMASQLGFSTSEFNELFVISETNLGIAASLNTPKNLVLKMRKALNEVKTNGTYTSLVKKWFPNIENKKE